MNKAIISVLVVVVIFPVFSQNEIDKYTYGLSYGYGKEFKNWDYAYTNSFYKAQFLYKINKSEKFHYQITIQPEYNKATHQLLNMYFVTPEEPDFLEDRINYMKLKNVNEYVLNIGMTFRKPLGKHWSVYGLLSVGPMITDTETERLSKGIAFADVAAIGFAYHTRQFTFDFRPQLRHTSNAGLQDSNAGFNTFNLEFGIQFL